jgi:hypothetical protein
MCASCLNNFSCVLCLLERCKKLSHYLSFRHIQRRCSSYSFLSSTLPIGVSDQCHTPAVLYSREGTAATRWIGGWVGPELVWTQRLQQKLFACAEDGTLVVQSVVRQYTDWATPAPTHKNNYKLKCIIQHQYSWPSIKYEGVEEFCVPALFVCFMEAVFFAKNWCVSTNPHTLLTTQKTNSVTLYNL